MKFGILDKQHTNTTYGFDYDHNYDYDYQADYYSSSRHEYN